MILFKSRTQLILHSLSYEDHQIFTLIQPAQKRSKQVQKHILTKTISPIFTELLHIHAHSDKNFTINMKENSKIYVEEDQIYILNITQITLRSYGSDGSTADRATLVQTFSPQSISGQTKFHILPNTTLSLSPDLWSSLTDAEQQAVASPGTCFKVIRSSIKFMDINVESDFKYTSTGVFIYPIYLQHHQLVFGMYLSQLNSNYREY